MIKQSIFFCVAVFCLLCTRAAWATGCGSDDFLSSDAQQAMLTSSFATSGLYGDVNNDGRVSIEDVTYLINILLTGSQYSSSADIDGDGKVNIEDVTQLIQILLTSESSTQTYRVNGVAFTMKTIQGGTFNMGATTEQGSDADGDESPVHQVTVSTFSISKTEVTQALWKAVMGTNPSSHVTSDLTLPVENVSWNDCQTFITKLNQMTGKQFRLPTEAEWEFAARGGTQSKRYKYAGGNTLYSLAWYNGNSSNQTHPVGTKNANELGLYDMSGNVYEWCQDWYGNYTVNAQTDPTGPVSGSFRVLRGGAYSFDAVSCRVSSRNNAKPTNSMPYFSTDSYYGLRLARSL